MQVTVTHNFTSAKSDSADPTLIQPSHWNDSHHVVIDTTPIYFSADYNFTAQTPGISLTSGITNTVTLTPVPKGVNGTDTQHYLYISGGTGTAESVLITGGTAVSNAASGTVTFVPANNHTGSWTIQSASTGIKEASVVLNGVGTVTLPLTVSTLYAPLVLPNSLSLVGQGFSGTDTTIGSVIQATVNANPAIVLEGSLYTRYAGQGVHRHYFLYGPNSGSTTGVWVGGDPAGVFAPVGTSGAPPPGAIGMLIRMEDVRIEGFVNAAINLQDQDQISFWRCSIVGRVLIPSTATGIQYTDFYDCIISVASGTAFQMDANSSNSGTVNFFGGQISGRVIGSAITFYSWGTHYEPNDTNVPIVDITGGIFQARGGLIAGHGAGVPYLIRAITGYVDLLIDGVRLINDHTITNGIVYSAVGGSFVLRNVFPLDIANFTAGLYSMTLSTAQLAAGALQMEVVVQSFDQIGVGLAAAATLTFPLTNYPRSGPINLTGATVGGSGVTAVAGLIYGQEGVLYAQNAQTFTTGATIGNTITLTPGLPYIYRYDGKIWIK